MLVSMKPTNRQALQIGHPCVIAHLGVTIGSKDVGYIEKITKTHIHLRTKWLSLHRFSRDTGLTKSGWRSIHPVEECELLKMRYAQGARDPWMEDMDLSPKAFIGAGDY